MVVAKLPKSSPGVRMGRVDTKNSLEKLPSLYKMAELQMKLGQCMQRRLMLWIPLEAIL